jgi:hypothetical protein
MPASGVFRRKGLGFMACGKNRASVSQFVAGIGHGRFFKPSIKRLMVTPRAGRMTDQGSPWQIGGRITEAMVEGFLATARRAGDDFDKQASEVRQRSMSLASEMLSNSMNFALKVTRAREPLELIQLQSEFLSHQAKVFSEQAKLLGESIARGANEVGRPPGLRKHLEGGPKPRKRLLGSQVAFF